MAGFIKIHKEVFMEFKQVMESRRSVRVFEDRPVSQEELDALITAAAWAPSPLNLQPWQFVVITEADAKQKVIGAVQQAHQGVIDSGGPEWVTKYRYNFVEQAPMLIAVLYDPNKGGLGSYFNNPHGALSAAAAAIQNMMLAATDMGLGTLWFTFFDPAVMRQALGAPYTLEVAGIIPVGVPMGETKTPPRKPPKVFSQQYGA
jgi:5,6-dimethylbenzimidazole synthase